MFIGFVDWLPQTRLFRHDTLSGSYYHPDLRWSQTMKLFDYHSSTLLYRVISIICQTLVYGKCHVLPFSSPTGADSDPPPHPWHTQKGYIHVFFQSRFTYYCEEPSPVIPPTKKTFSNLRAFCDETGRGNSTADRERYSSWR